MRYSILVPAFKAAFLDECLRSVVTQDCDDWELVVVDDASPDDLRSIVLPYLSDPRVSYRRNAVGYGAASVVGNWNECLRHASGEFVICMGDDDVLLPGCLSRYDSLIATHPGRDAYHTRIVVIDATGAVIEDGGDRPETEDAGEVLWRKWQGRRQAMGDWLLRRSTLTAHGGFADFPYGWASDDVTAAMTATNTGVANCNIAGYGFRRHEQALTRAYSPEQTLGKLEAWDMVAQWVRQWLPTLPSGTRHTTDINQDLNKYIARRKRGDLYHGLTPSPTTLWRYLRADTGLCAPTVLALYLKRLFC